QSLPPEDVQLFYQTALLGRRDLPLAPDPRAGFEMVLLRMLAFKPQGVLEVPTQSPPSSTREPAPLLASSAEPAPPAATMAPKPEAAAPSSPAPSVTPAPGRPAPQLGQTRSEGAQATSHAPAPQTPAPAQQTPPPASRIQQASVQPPVAPEPPPFDGPYD